MAEHKCECDLRTKLVGDGCEVCNPTKALEYAKEELAALKREIAALESELAEWKRGHGELCSNLADCVNERDKLRHELAKRRAKKEQVAFVCEAYRNGRWTPIWNTRGTMKDEAHDMRAFVGSDYGGRRYTKVRIARYVRAT